MRGPAADGAYSRHELQEEPIAQNDEGGDGEKEDDDEGQDFGAGVKNDVGAHYAGDGAAGSESGDRGMEIEEDVGEVRADAACEIEEEVGEMAEVVLDIVAEDPEEEHVAGDVQEAHVKKHAGEEGEEGGFEAYVAGEEAADVGGDGGVGIEKDFVLSRREGELVEEDDDVGQDEKRIDYGRGAVGVEIFERDEHWYARLVCVGFLQRTRPKNDCWIGMVNEDAFAKRPWRRVRVVWRSRERGFGGLGAASL